MIRDAILLYSVYSAALLIAGIVGYFALRALTKE